MQPHSSAASEADWFRLFVGCVRDYAVFVADVDRTIRTWNPGAERLFGYKASEVLGGPIDRLYTPEDREAGAPQREIETALAGGNGGEGRWMARRDGSRFWASGEITPLREGTEEVARVVVLLRDRTAFKEEEERSRFRAHLLDAVGQAVIATEPTGRVTYWNRAAEAAYGWTRDEAEGRPITDLVIPAESMAAAAGAMDRLRAGESWSGEIVVRRRDGNRFPAFVTDAPIFAADGSLAAIVGVSTDVSELRRSEAALRESEGRLRALTDNLPDGAVYQMAHDADGRPRFTFLSGGVERIFGVRPETALADASALYGRIHEDDRARLAAAEAESLRTRRRFDCEFRHLMPDGEVRWANARSAPRRTEAGLVWEGVLLDVTDRKRAEEERERSEEHLRAIIVATPECVKLVAADGSLLHMNAAGLRMIEADDLESVAGGSVFDLVAPEHRAAWKEFHARVCGGAAERFEFDIVGLKGTARSMETHAVPVRMPDGTVAHLAVTRDVSVRKRAEDELARATAESDRRRRLYETILSNTPDLAYVWGLDHRFVYANEGLLRMWGRTWEEAIGKNCLELGYEPWHAALHDREIDQVVATKKPVRGEVPFAGAFGTRIYDYILVPVIGESGEVEAVAGTTRDVTERQRSEADLRFLADASAALADLSDADSTLRKLARLAVPRFADWCAVDLIEEGRLRRVAVAHADPAKVELAHDLHERFPPAPDAPRGVWRILATGESELVPEITDEVLDAAVLDPEVRDLMRKLGLRSYLGVPLKLRDRVLGVLTFIAAESPRRYGAGELAVAEDLARRAAVAVENARLYDELRETDRRKDEFLAMLAHELRNPLAPIKSGLDLLRMEGVDSEIVEVMSEQVGHVVRLVEDLLDVSRILRGKVELRRVPVELATVVRRAVETVRPMTEADGQAFSVSLPASPVWLDADPVRLAQVLSNLLTNASKYTEPGGRVTLSAEVRAGQVVVRVTDTGIGIDADLLPRVFDLFTQSARSIDRAQGGLGIGLTIVRNLVEMHGGAVTAASGGAGQGSEFTVRLPTIAAPALAGRNGRPPAASAVPLRILVVDDNVPGARLLDRLLSKLGGHQVRTVHDGEAALAAAEEMRPDAVFLDIGLPKIDGYGVARRLRAKPDFRETLLVALTGYGGEDDRRRSADAGFDAHLVKPPSVEMLLATLSHPKLGRSPESP